MEELCTSSNETTALYDISNLCVANSSSPTVSAETFATMNCTNECLPFDLQNKCQVLKAYTKYLQNYGKRTQPSDAVLSTIKTTTETPNLEQMFEQTSNLKYNGRSKEDDRLTNVHSPSVDIL